ncbi:MAG: hypothetical protein Q9170_007439 [Blastenia crenularia]
MSERKLNIIRVISGTTANLGMYIGGIPVGMLVDHKGPRPGVIMGGGLMTVGYFSIHRAYESGPGSIALPWLCFFAFMTGIGGASAFSGSIKTSALNWPNHRGSATAFPLSAFGLGAFFFTAISSLAFPDNTSSFLLLLSIGCLTMCYVSVAFLRIIPQGQSYVSVPADDGRRSSNPLRRTKSEGSKHSVGRPSQEPGMQPYDTLYVPSGHKSDENIEVTLEASDGEADENSSLISSSPGDVPYQDDGSKSAAHHDSQHVDVRGFALLTHVEFYQLWLLLGILTGVGLMTIKALWNHYDDSAPLAFIEKRQLRHVMLLSVLSCVGRLCSGIGSDLIVKKLHASRFWCLFISSSIFCIAQLCGTQIGNPHLLGFVSAITGLGYGFLFGVYPSLVAETFGINGLSQNWGAMTLSPIVFGNIFNLLYGHIYDSHSYNHDGQKTCPDGLECYRVAYWVTFAGSLTALGISLWSIRHAYVKKAKAKHSARLEDRDA